MRYRQCYACVRTKCQPGPAGPPNPLAYHARLPLPFYGNYPESSQAGRASISARLGGLGGYSEWGLDAGIIFHADKSEFTETDKKYSEKQIITEIYF